MSLNEALAAYFSNERNVGHYDRAAIASPLDEIRDGLRNSGEVGLHSLEQIHGDGITVLECGCSWGGVVFGLARSERVGHVIGIDVEEDALRLGREIASSELVPVADRAKVRFENGALEALPFPDRSFELIVCHTVIEHVKDVEGSLREMVRVLKPGGVIHLRAPNYLWPYEPHMRIPLVPFAPKAVAKRIARLFGAKDPDFLDHLQFVRPSTLERAFGTLPIRFENLFVEKLRVILVDGDFSRIVGRRSWVPALAILHGLWLTKPVFRAVVASGIYPSLEYRLIKTGAI